MNYDELVDFIVKEVYERIKNISDIEDHKGKLVFFYEEDIDKYNSLPNKEYKAILYSKHIKDCDAVFLSKLCLTGLANLATLNLVTEEQVFMIKMLMKGKKVYIAEEGIQYKNYKNTAPIALYNKYVNFEKELIKSGIQIVKSIGSLTVKQPLRENIKSEVTKGNSIEENLYEIRDKKLISEIDLKKPFMNGMKTVVIDKNSIITPLANDFIRLHHLKIERV